MKLKDIALRDALRLYLSNYEDEDPYIITDTIYNAIDGGEIEWPGDLGPWQPFEDYSPDELYDVIENAYLMNLSTYKEILALVEVDNACFS